MQVGYKNKSGMSKPVTDKWFVDYAALLSELSIKDVASHIQNLDESGFQDHFIPKKALGERSASHCSR